MPTWVAAILVVAASVLGTLLLVYFVRTNKEGYQAPGTDDLEAVYIQTLGTLYAIFLAFMIFTVWSRFYQATLDAESEANCVTSIHALSRALPRPLQDEMQRLCIDYADLIIYKEWPAMQRHADTAPSQRLIHRWWRVVDGICASPGQPIVRDHILAQWIELTDLRRSRLLLSHVRLPGVLYAVLVLGAVVTVAAAAVFKANGFWLHAFKACLLSSMISLMLFTVIAVDSPFQGPVSVRPTAFEHTLRIMRQSMEIDSPSQASGGSAVMGHK